MARTKFVQDLLAHGEYVSPPARQPWSNWLPGGAACRFYARVFWEVGGGYVDDVLGRFDDAHFIAHCVKVLRGVEAVGGRVEVRGTRHLGETQGPVVIVGNHMSTLETQLLPAVVLPYRPLTFVVKESLLRYPVFGRVMRAVEPIAVARENAREDLVTVLEEGAKVLAAGRSLIIFPQSTRTATFDVALFNTLGVKLARRAGVPVIPLALKTDFWGNGQRFKEFGAITPAATVYVEFGAPLTVQGTGREAQAQIVAFITERLRRWGGQVAEAGTDVGGAGQGVV